MRWHLAAATPQVTLAVLVCSWAHVLHATFKPWGRGSAMYMLQHGSLFVTSFVFLMGLLFKVNGVSIGSATYEALSDVMLGLCAAFIGFWLIIVLVQVVRRLPELWRRRLTSVIQTTGELTRHCRRSCCVLAI